MLTLTCKLNELNDDGLWLVRRLHTIDRADARPAIQGATVSISKLHELRLRSRLTVWERAERFDRSGRVRAEPMSDEEHEHWRRVVEVYGNEDTSRFTFNPIRHLYEYGRHCIHCVQAEMSAPAGQLPVYRDNHILPSCTSPNHPERLDALRPNPIPQINELGRFAQWWCEFGGFEPIAPRQPNIRTEQALAALFGSRGSVPIELPIGDEPDAGILN